MEIEPQQREILGKLGNLTITANSNRETDIEITDGTDLFEILCASPWHPYCRESENNFLNTAYLNSLGNPQKTHEKICVTFYARNKATLKVKKIVIQATVNEKHHGVRSGIIIEPKELAGFICAPTNIAKTVWIVVRPFENRPDYENPSALKGRVTPPANKFALNCPRVYPKAHSGAFNEARERYIKFGRFPQGIFDGIEANRLLEKIEGVRLPQATNGHPGNYRLKIGTDQNPLETLDQFRIPEQKVVLISNSPYCWPRMRGERPSEFFDNSYMDGSEYLEFTFAVVETGKDELIIRPLLPISHPDTVSCSLFRPASEITATTGQNIATRTQSVLLK